MRDRSSIPAKAILAKKRTASDAEKVFEKDWVALYGVPEHLMGNSSLHLWERFFMPSASHQLKD